MKLHRNDSFSEVDSNLAALVAKDKNLQNSFSLKLLDRFQNSLTGMFLELFCTKIVQVSCKTTWLQRVRACLDAI